VLTQFPPLGKPAGEFKSIDRHSREAGELYHLADAQKFHRDAPLSESFAGTRSLACMTQQVTPGIVRNDPDPSVATSIADVRRPDTQ
jgi:hypothetical protein